MIPANLLKQALLQVGGTTVTWRPRTGREQNARGDFVTSYAPDKELYGSWQPLTEGTAINGQQGYSSSGSMYNFFVSEDVLSTDRIQSNDLIVKDCVTYDVVSVRDWYGFNGWKVVTCSKQI